MIIEWGHLALLGVLLVLSTVILCWTQMKMGFFAGKRSKEKCIEIAKRKHKAVYGLFCFLARFFLPALITALGCCVFAYAHIHPEVDHYTYRVNSLATQKDDEVLFNEAVVDTTEEEEQEDRTDKLHIPERFIGRTVDSMMYNYFCEELSKVYGVNGTKDGYGDSPPKIAPDSGALYDDVDSPIIQGTEEFKGAKQYRADYNANPNQGSLYQYGRALSEVEVKGNSVSFAVIYSIMSESMYSMESFLEYKDRTVGEEEGRPEVIEANWVAFSEGKMFLRNSRLVVNSEEGTGFSDCFLVEAFASFEIALGQIDPSSGNYVLFSYYVGNAGQNMLYKIDKDSDPGLYLDIGSKAMRGYKEAQKYYVEDSEGNLTEPEDYVTELGMLNNINDGIKALIGLGIPEQ